MSASGWHAGPAPIPGPPLAGAPFARPAHAGPQPDAVPSLGLAVLVVLLIAAGLSTWVVHRSEHDDRTELASGPNGGAVLPERPGLPRTIDQPWTRTESANSQLSFEFPSTLSMGGRTLDDGVSSRYVDAWQDLDARVICYDADFESPGSNPPSSGSVDFGNEEDRSRLAHSELATLRTSPDRLEAISTPVGPGTRFGGTLETLVVRGVVVGNGSTATWCLVLLPPREAALADLTLQRIITTMAPVR